MTRSVKVPGPDNPIEIAPFGARVRVLWKGDVAAIAGHLAFYPNRVDRIEVGPG